MNFDGKGFRAEGAYAVILSPARHVLLVRTNGGRLYLPGGRVEPGESVEDALVREIEEECGHSATVRARLGSAEQPVFGGRSLIRAHYFEASLGRRLAAPEHETLCLPADEAARRVHRRGDAWAIAAALEQQAAMAEPLLPAFCAA